MLERILVRTIPKMITVKLDLENGLETISGDSSQIQQLIMNLAINARDAMPQGGEIQIKTCNIEHAPQARSLLDLETVEGVTLCISDSGMGMDKKTLERIYEPFFTTKAPGRGTGLGLSIVYGIVRSHGGKIVCQSEPGNGATFTIYFPSIDQEVSSFEEHGPKELVGGKETILLVDDETDVRELGEELLTSFGYKTLTASNGREGLEMFKAHPNVIDIVILDLVMPEMDGLECLKHIREIDPDAKVIVASGFASNGRAEDALREGAIASLKKPYEISEILALLRSRLDQDK
jgi:CheY-like chemotaxis protein